MRRRPRPNSRRRTITVSIRRRASLSSASTPMIAVSTRRSAWRTGTSYWCRAATILWVRRTVTISITSTSWPDPCGVGSSVTIRRMHGSSAAAEGYRPSAGVRAPRRLRELERPNPVREAYVWLLAPQHGGEVVHLQAVRLCVALEKEILERCPRSALLGPDRDAGGRQIVDADRPFGPERLDALIVAVTAAAAVADERHPPRGSTQQHLRRVDIVGGSDRGVDQTGGHGVDLHDRLREQPSGDVEVVNGHVLEEAAAHLDVAHRRRRGIVADDVQCLEAADGSGLKLLAQGAEARIETPVEA